ncbi:MAG: SpoIVB peptidase S55 domain-containing protein, partial [Acidobacteriota bacterium]
MTIKHTATLIAILSFCLGQLAASTLTMPLEQIKPGMKGKGKSVFLGRAVEEFDIEVLGVVQNVQPKRNVILARLSGKDLEKTGIIQGMSGSPVYIDGKLIGAVAYSFSFAKEPVAGITPIGEMLAIAEQPKQSRPAAASMLPLRSSLSLDDLLLIQKNLFSGRTSFVSQGKTFAPLGVPLLFGGFSPGVVEKVRPLLAGWGFSPVGVSTDGQRIDVSTPSAPALREGDPVAVELVSGDLRVAAVGTVTQVDGDKVLAFGHPLYNLGKVDYAMSQAEVLAVVPSLESSFKLAAVGARVGRFIQDRAAGTLGELGKMPQLVPVNIRLIESGGKIKEFKIELANDKVFTALLTNMTVSSLLASEERSYGDLSCALEGDLYLDSGASVHLEDLFSGNLDTATTNLSGLLTAVVYYLTNNEFQEVGIHRLDLNLRVLEEAKFAYLERIWLDKYEVSAGERIQVKIYCRAFGGQSFEEAVVIEAPPLPAGSEFHRLIGD